MALEVKLGLPGDHVVFSSGRYIHANCGIVGLDVSGDADGMTVYGGYDGGNRVDDDNLSSADCEELADHMIACWTAWRDLHRSLG